MNKNRLMILLVVLIFLFGLGLASCHVVPEGQVGVRGQDQQQVILKPGLHIVWPWVKLRLLNVQGQMSHFQISLPQHNENLAVAVMWQAQDVPLYLKKQENKNEIMLDLKKVVQKLVTPALIHKTSSSADLAILVKNALQKNKELAAKGITIKQVWITGLMPTEAEQQKIFNNMKGLAATIGQRIMENGEVQAEKVRSQAEKGFIQSQTAALSDAAKILGHGNSDAVKVMAPLYHQNPALFKAYVAAKMKLLTETTSS